jgi:hypothetical protein
MKRLVVLAVAALAAVSTTVRGESLGDLIAQHGVGWIIGNWADKATGGQGLKVSFEWRLDKHAVAVKVQTPARQAEGIIARNPKSGDVGYVAVDNQGGGALGKFSEEDGKVVLKLSYQAGDGESGRLAIVHEKVEGDSIKISIHKLDESGTVGEAREHFVMARMKE